MRLRMRIYGGSDPQGMPLTGNAPWGRRPLRSLPPSSAEWKEPSGSAESAVRIYTSKHLRECPPPLKGAHGAVELEV
jgi:hypothetical protein